MPAFSFRGFTAGSSVALSAAQGANTSSGTVTTWGQQDVVGSLDILTVATGALTAPAGIWLEAVDIAGFAAPGGPGPGETYDPSFHEITYIWTVNGEPLAPYSAPQNMVAGWNNPNVAYGKKVAFHFPDPGTYQIDLWAVDRNGVTGTASTTIAVSNADSLYPGTQTVCFSNAAGETWRGEKLGCQHATTFAALQSAIDASSGPLRILFKRGQTVPVAQVSRLRINTQSQWLNHVGAWGSGAKPVVSCRNSGFVFELLADNPVTHLTFDNIDFRGGWDAASETGIASWTPFFFIQNANPCHYTISRCEFSGLESIWFGAGTTSSTMIVADTVATNWRDYGSFIHEGVNQRFALIGSRFQQNIDAQSGAPNGAGKNGFYNDHGPIRWSFLKDTYVACSDFFSRNGWSPLAPDNADQPCIRVNSKKNAGSVPASCTIERCVCEGGFQIVTISGHDTGVTEYPDNYLIDRALLIATSKTFNGFINAEYGGTTMRNCLGILPNVPAYHSNGWAGAVKLESQAPAPGNLDSPMQVYGNSFVNLRNTANDPGDTWPVVTQVANFTNTTFENNIVHAPGLDTPVSAQGQIDLSTTIAGVTPRYKGVFYNQFGQENGTLTTSVGNGASFTLPYPSGTGQSYWQAIETLDTLHRLNASGGAYHAELGDFTVTFEASVVRITNTSGQSWNNGTSWSLKLDRKSHRSPIPATYANPSTLPLPRPQSTIGTGLGLLPYDDFGKAPRVANSAGAIEP